MAEATVTPVKVYGKAKSKSTCRLCCSVCDPQYAKNIYHERNVGLLSLAEHLFSTKLVNADYLPHLLCRPCERRLINLGKFRDVVCKSQHSLVQKKRCSVEMSPSLPAPQEKISKVVTVDATTKDHSTRVTRRSLFSSNEENEVRKLFVNDML